MILLEFHENDFQVGLTLQKKLDYEIGDPRIGFVSSFLENLRKYFPQKFTPSNFRLQNYSDWLIKTTISDVIVQASWPCKTNCIFCYEKGIPKSLLGRYRLSKEEMLTRLKYFNPLKNIGLPGRMIYCYDEVLNNPYVFSLLGALNKKRPSASISITTSGTALTEEYIKKLAQLKSVCLIISLNSANPEIRKYFMHDMDPEIAINSFSLLKKYEVSYMVSIVPWPGLPFDDMEKTIKFAQDNDASSVRICLPGYSKFFSSRHPFNRDDFWNKLTRFFMKIKLKYTIPIDIDPFIFSENLYNKHLDRAHITGVIKHSPAYYAGIKANDIIIKINGEKIIGREHAKQLLSKKIKVVTLTIQRNVRVFKITLRKTNEKYPYIKSPYHWFSQFGLIIPQGIHHEDMNLIGRYAKAYNAKSVLLMTSMIMKPTIKYLLKKLRLEKHTKIHLEVPKNIFWGGSINAGDLITTEDFISAIKTWCKTHKKPDLVIVPFSPFLPSGRDSIGRTFLDIERNVDIPVEFIYNELILK